MQIIVSDTAHDSIDNVFEYLANYSLKNAYQTVKGIYEYIGYLENSPYIGRYIPEFTDKRFREIIYKRTRNSTYRIIYFISESKNKIHIIYVMNSRQDIKRFFKLLNYFKNY